MLWIKLLPIMLAIALGLAQLGLEHRWHDRRTRKYRRARNAVVVLFLVSSVAAGVVIYYEHRSGRQLSSKLDTLGDQNDELRRQVARLQEQLDDAKSSRITGLILPSNEPRPQHPCGAIPERALALFFGNGVAYVTGPRASIPLLSIGEQTIVTLYREAEGVYLSALLFRQDGRAVATILGNRFGINPSNYFRITSRDRHELRIVDGSGTEVFNARFLNENTFQLTGIFYAGPDQALVVEPNRIQIGYVEFRGPLCVYERTSDTAMFRIGKDIP